MAKLKYDSRLVDNTISELGDASSQLINTEDEMRSALTIIANARGIRHVHTDTLFNTLGYPGACQELIEETIANIKTRAKEVEEYNKEYESSSWLTKLGSTAGLFLTKVCEGFGSAGEQIVDGFASVLGFAAGLVSKDAQNSIANFIKKDHVGDFFDGLYSGSLKKMVQHSWADVDGLACNIFKGVGTGLGYAAALAATGGIAGGVSTGTMLGAKAGASVLLSSLPAAVTVAGVAGVGAGTQAGLQGGWDYNDAFGYGIKYGAIQAGTTIVFSYAFKLLAKGFNILKTKLSGTGKSTSLVVVNNNGSGGGAGGTAGAGSTAGASSSSGSAAASTAKSGVTFKSYKGYTTLDDVWDDVMAGKLTKGDVTDIVRNTVGLDDGGLGHTFMSDAMNVLRGKGGSAVTPAWKELAARAATGSGDEMTAAVVNNANGTIIQNAAGDTFENAASSVSQDIMEGAARQTNTGSGSTALMVIDDSLSKSADEIITNVVVNNGNEVVTNALVSSGDEVLSGVGAHVGDDVILHTGDDIIASAGDDISTSLQKAYADYDELLLKRDMAVQKLTDLGEIPGNAPKAEFDAAKAAIAAIDDEIALAGQRIADLADNGAGSTALTVVDKQSTALTVVDKPNTSLAVVDKPGLPAVVQKPSSTALVVVDDVVDDLVPVTKPGLPAVVEKPGLPAVVQKPGLPAVIDDVVDDLVPVPPNPTTPVPVPTPTVPVVPGQTPVIPGKDTIIFGVVEPDPIPTSPDVVITPTDFTPVVIPPDVTPPIETPPIITPPIETPIVTPPIETPPIYTPPIETPIPTDPIVSEPQPTPTQPEYVPIPNTGLAGNTSRGFMPAVAGAVTGLVGAIAGMFGAKKKNNDDDEDDVEELEEDESEE